MTDMSWLQFILRNEKLTSRRKLFLCNIQFVQSTNGKRSDFFFWKLLRHFNCKKFKLFEKCANKMIEIKKEMWGKSEQSSFPCFWGFLSFLFYFIRKFQCLW
jgi:hypothetical protein